MTSEVYFDFVFMGKEGEALKTIQLAGVNERAFGMLMASVVLRNTTRACVTKTIMAFFQEFCREFWDPLVRSDQEVAMSARL